VKQTNKIFHKAQEYVPLSRDGETTGSRWCSNGKENGYFGVDFNESRILLESYIYRAHSRDFQPPWQVLGSNDGVNWDIVCFYKAFQQPSDAFHTLNFPCNASKPYRIIKHFTIHKRFYMIITYIFMEWSSMEHYIHKTRTLKRRL
jgi:hypothetical protein